MCTVNYSCTVHVFSFLYYRSIHLCNNSVQKNFSISDYRSDELPGDNMWDCVTFKDFLRLEQYNKSLRVQMFFTGKLANAAHVHLH